MGIELSKESFIKKNQKSTKYITIILIGMLILIVVFPSSNKNEKSLMSNDYKMYEVSYSNHEQDMVMYYENRLKDILEKTYGAGNIHVMINLSTMNNSTGFYKESETKYVVDGVLIIAKVGDEKALADISHCVAALFDLPAHKVAVIIKK